MLGFQPDPVLREHSAPNIDANADGVVGIAWQESSVETAQITVVSASYPPPGYTYISRNLTFAEGYFLAGANRWRTKLQLPRLPGIPRL